jgi:hypothetical protein
LLILIGVLLQLRYALEDANMLTMRSHLRRTYSHFRYKHTKPTAQKFRPLITKITEPVPNVRGLELDVSETPDFTYLPGQWLDFHHIDRDTGKDHVAGFSITSAPGHNEKKLHLAIKKTYHPISRYK